MSRDPEQGAWMEGWSEGLSDGARTERTRIVALLRKAVKDKAPRRLSQIDRGWMLALLDHVESTHRSLTAHVEQIMLRRTPLKRTGPLRRTSWLRGSSVKGRARRAVRADLVAKILDARPLCEMGDALEAAIPGHRCDRLSVDVHEPHTRGRGGSPLDEDNAVSSCRACHNAAHAHPIVAKDLGLLQSEDPAVSILHVEHAQICFGSRRTCMSAPVETVDPIDAPHEVRVFFREFTAEHGRGPTVAEVVDALPHIPRVHRILGDMINCGHVIGEEHAGTRTLQLTRVGASYRFDGGRNEKAK